MPPSLGYFYLRRNLLLIIYGEQMELNIYLGLNTV